MKRIAALNIFAIVLSLLLTAFAHPVFATSLNEAAIRLDRMGAGAQFNTTTGYKVLVVLKPQTVGSIGKVQVTFPTTNGFTINSTAANFGTSTSGLPSTFHGTSLTAATVTGSVASAVSGGVVTFDVTSMSSATTLYGFYIICGSTTCITNPSTGNAGIFTINIATLTSGSAVIDSMDTAVDITTTNADQVTLTASVAPTFSLSLGGNSIALGTLSTTGRTTGNVTATVSTNAQSGWVAYLRSEGTAALASATSGDSISSTDTGSCVTTTIGSKGYVVDVNSSAGTGGTGALTVASKYNCTDNQAGGVILTTYDQIADRTGVVSGDTLTLNAIVTISATTKAASDYTDTWDVVGAGDF